MGEFRLFARAVTDLREVLAVVPAGDDSFIAPYTYDRGRAMDGGQLAAQALNAALHTVESPFDAHSIHGSFLSAGNPLMQVELHVDRDRDGRGFCQRNVTARQEGRLLFRMSASFQRPAAGPDVQMQTMPTAPAPLDCEIFDPGIIGYEARDPDSALSGRRRAWIRPATPLGADTRWNTCALLYITDMFNVLPARLEVDEHNFQTSLDHSVWFHRPAVIDEWVLMSLHSTSLASGRGWFMGEYFSLGGVHLATSAQEMVYRAART